MKHASKLYKERLTLSQILNHKRLTQICTRIEEQIHNGVKSLYLDCWLSEAERIYLRLYGYKVHLDFDGDSYITW